MSTTTTTTTTTTDATTSENASGVNSPMGTGRARFRRPRPLVSTALGLLGISVVVAVIAVTILSSQQAVPPTAPVVPVYDARGRIVPVRQARVATQQGGIVRWVLRQPGGQVAGGEQLGRILGPTGEVEVLSAPYAATLLDVPVQLGDTLLPGALVALIGDLSELRVQTTDVDEYLIASISVGLPVEISVDALPGRMFGGRVEMVSPGAEAGTGSRLQYPVVITVDNGDPALRPGMTAHLRFKAQTRGQ